MSTEITNFDRRDSVTLKMNAKGEYSYDSKIYYDSTEDDISGIMNWLIDIDMEIKENFINGDD